MLAFLFVFLLGSTTYASGNQTAQPEKLPLRVVFLGSAWSAGTWTKPEESVAARFGQYLGKYLNQKVDVRSVAVRDISEVPTLAQAELSKKQADYVFYFCDHSARPIEFASRAYAPWKSEGDGFLDYLGRQIGAIRLGSKINGSGYPEDILLNPMTEVMRQSSQIATYYGAKFILLWPGFSIAPFSWDAQVPEGAKFKALTYLDFLKSKPRISSERLNYHLRMKGVSHIANLQLTNFFQALRDSADANVAFTSKDTSDKVGEMLATSVVSQEF